MVLLTATSNLLKFPLLLTYWRSTHKNPKKIHRRTMSTLSLLWNSNKNKQNVATNTMRRPSHRHCRSDYAGNGVKNCTFIAVIEGIQRPFLFSSHDATTPLCRCR